MRKSVNPIAVALVCGAMASFASSSKGALITVPNFSFEDPALADGNYTSSPPTGWTSTGNNQIDSIGVQNWQNAQFPGTTQVGGVDGLIASPGDGYQSIYINAKIGGVVETNQLQSGTLATVNTLTTYTLTVSVGERNDFNAQGISHLVLLVNGTPAATSADINHYDLIAGAFKDFSATFTTGGTDPLVGGALSVLLQETATTSGNQQVNFDNVRLDASPVPEPASLAVLGLATGLIGLRRRR